MGMDNSIRLGLRWINFGGTSGAGVGSGTGVSAGAGVGVGAGSGALGLQDSKSIRTSTTEAKIDHFFIIPPPIINVAV